MRRCFTACAFLEARERRAEGPAEDDGQDVECPLGVHRLLEERQGGDNVDHAGEDAHGDDEHLDLFLPDLRELLARVGKTGGRGLVLGQSADDRGDGGGDETKTK